MIVLPNSRLVPAVLRLFALVALLALFWPAPALASNTVTAVVTGGDRSARASTIQFEQIMELAGQRYQLGSGTLVIDDASGTNAGWRVAISVPGEDVQLTALAAPRLIVGQAIDAQSGPVAPVTNALGPLTSPRVVLAAAPGFGKGQYELAFSVVRALPASGASASLTLTVTITPAS